ncbi:hypothetical protein J3458_022428 [Metarhizium acridum]|uniref:uncharacterized protein n=1 Tax=Metarhizium acridum TaxID=92637 RepID=UPI001C6BB03F|nr:hypothetical protein J3458_022428 [Metarhizium acridum]
MLMQFLISPSMTCCSGSFRSLFGSMCFGGDEHDSDDEPLLPERLGLRHVAMTCLVFCERTSWELAGRQGATSPRTWQEMHIVACVYYQRPMIQLLDSHSHRVSDPTTYIAQMEVPRPDLQRSASG